MLNSIKIKNFRCFDEIEVEGFKRVNFIVGQNATGKTALLEGLITALKGSLENLYSLNVLRDRDADSYMANTKELYDLVWASYFNNYNIKNKITFEFNYNSIENNVAIFFDEFYNFPQSSYITGSGFYNNTTPSIPSYIPITLSRNLNGVGDQTSAMINQFGQIAFQPVAHKYNNIEFFNSNFNGFNISAVKNYSKLSSNNLEKKAVDSIIKIFPQIENLEVLQLPYPALHAKVKGLNKKIPLALISSGVNKIVTLILAIIANEDGILFIDEIENGIHTSILEKFWEVLYDLADKNNVQLFITSHSLECMNAAEKTVDAHPDDFALFKMVDENGKIQAKQFSGNILKNVLESDYDFR
jgi:AAA15 family ATPase/GTPase